jgi:protein-S-isoprenylcysteine O-methyltransferase Ste14
MIFGHANPAAIVAVVAVALGIHLFVLFYEEPTLRGKFGADYEEHCRNVDIAKAVLIADSLFFILNEE